MNYLLLIGLFFCHFLADYTPLSTPTMLAAKKLGTPLYPILNHGFVHGLLMGLVLLFYTDNHDLWYGLFAFQVISHTLIDTLKGRMNGWFPALQSPANPWHWVVFGFDQFLHAAVIVAMAAIVAKYA
jgi:hypothetical protein